MSLAHITLNSTRNNEAERSLFRSPWWLRRAMEGFQDCRGLKRGWLVYKRAGDLCLHVCVCMFTVKKDTLNLQCQKSLLSVCFNSSGFCSHLHLLWSHPRSVCLSPCLSKSVAKQSVDMLKLRLELNKRTKNYKVKTEFQSNKMWLF